jgi:hypothetical protein
VEKCGDGFCAGGIAYDRNALFSSPTLSKICGVRLPEGRSASDTDIEEHLGCKSAEGTLPSIGSSLHAARPSDWDPDALTHVLLNGSSFLDLRFGHFKAPTMVLWGYGSNASCDVLGSDSLQLQPSRPWGRVAVGVDARVEQALSHDQCPGADRYGDFDCYVLGSTKILCGIPPGVGTAFVSVCWGGFESRALTASYAPPQIHEVAWLSHEVQRFRQPVLIRGRGFGPRVPSHRLQCRPSVAGVCVGALQPVRPLKWGDGFRVSQ